MTDVEKILAWLRRNKIVNSGAATIDAFASLYDDEGEGIDPLDVANCIADAIARGDYLAVPGGKAD